MSSRAPSFAVLLAALLAVACGGASDLDAGPRPDAGRPADDGPAGDDWEATRCRLALPPDVEEGAGAGCFDLVTTLESGAELRTHTVVLEPDLPATPVVVLMGGPGLLGDAYLRHQDRDLRRARFGERPVVYVEQRGVGASEPALVCGATEPASTCLGRLVNRGISLDEFSSRRAAQDVSRVVDALGRGPVLLAGGSYGSRLALEVLRVAPDRVAAAYLESVVPPDQDFLEGLASGTGVALDALWAACADDPTCAEAHPDPEADLLAAYARAETDPVTTPFGPLEPTLLTLAVIQAQYHQDLAGTLPAGLAAAAAGSVAEASIFVENAAGRPDSVERLLYAVVVCLDFAPLADPAAYAAALTATPEPLHAPLAALSPSQATCEALRIDPGPAGARMPVTYDGPVLLVTPALDGRTPRSGAQRVARTLPNAREVVLPRRTHTPGLGYQLEGRDPDRCAAGIVRAFLDDPEAEPDLSCADAPDILDWR